MICGLAEMPISSANTGAANYGIRGIDGMMTTCGYARRT
jgi:hypothetical protein